MAYNVLDEELEGYLQLVKTDTETGKAVKIANTAFALYKLDDKGNRTQATYDFLTISHDGTKGEVTVTLPLGKYTITEVKAPYGFVLTQQSYSVGFGWDNQRNDIVLAKTIVSHEQDEYRLGMKIENYAARHKLPLPW